MRVKDAALNASIEAQNDNSPDEASQLSLSKRIPKLLATGTIPSPKHAQKSTYGKRPKITPPLSLHDGDLLGKLPYPSSRTELIAV
jgi:hypothetical protein